MLHIVFLILKIIGIILAVILGILVLLVCIVLFVPVCYQGKAACEKTTDTLHAAIKATWLLGLIRFYYKYEDQKAKYTIRIGWKRIAGGRKDVKEEAKEVDASKEEKDKGVEEAETPGKNVKEAVSQKEPEKALKEDPESVQKVCSKGEKELSSKAEKRISSEAENISDDVEASDKRRDSFIQKIKRYFSGWKRRLCNIRNKIKCTFTNICDKIKELSKKKDEIMAFFKDADHKKAFVKTKKEAGKLLKRLKPRKIFCRLRFGLEDPSATGYVLAGLAVLYPFLGEDTKITPDFEEAILQGKLMIQGRIYMIHLVCMIWNLLWYKPVRQSYRDIRELEW